MLTAWVPLCQPTDPGTRAGTTHRGDCPWCAASRRWNDGPVAAGRRALLPLVLATMASQALLVVLSPTLVAVAGELGASVGTVGQARSVTAAAAVLTSVALMSRADARGVRATVSLGAVLAVLACGAVAAAHSTAVFLAAHVLVGVALALLLSAGFGGMAVFERRSWAAGYLAAANSAAWVLVSPVVGYLTSTVSWRLAMAAPAVVALAALVASPAIVAPARRAAPARLTAAVRDRSARRWAGAELAADTGWTAVLTFSGAFFVERLGTSEAQVGWLLAGAAATHFVASSRAGVLGRRLAPRRLAVLGALWMAAVTPVMLGTRAAVPWAFAWFCVACLGAGVRTPASAALGIEQLPGHPATMMAARTAVTQSGYLLGAVGAGAVVSGPGYGALGWALAGVMVLAAALPAGFRAHRTAAA